MRYLWLNFHLGYACRDSGACCSSGWPIPVERDRVIPIRALAARPDASWLVPAAGGPDEVAGMLAMGDHGHCVFHGAGCAVYAARPASCVHFPYVCLIDVRGVRVTLSHYCPTAASMLFEDQGPVAIVEGPPPVPGIDIPEGLDARESLPPLASENRLMTFEAFSEWERAEAGRVAGSDAAPPSAKLFEQARRAVPAPWSWPPAPVDLDAQWVARVAPGWPQFAAVIQRYRAAKIFASWAAYQGDGPVAVVRVADTAIAVLKVEAVRQCLQAGRSLDAGLLTQAIRQADLLLVHYADSRVLSSGTSS